MARAVTEARVATAAMEALPKLAPAMVAMASSSGVETGETLWQLVEMEGITVQEEAAATLARPMTTGIEDERGMAA